MSGDHMRHGPHDLQSHPIADAFPMMVGTEFDELVADIKANGVREPIVIHEGKILDGRNRYKAAQAAGVECRRTEYQGTDPIKYVVSVNLRRRQLDESQRAWVAANIANLKLGDNQHSPIGEPSVTREQAAGLLNVSPRAVDRARVVREYGAPELQEKVAAGEVSVSAAADVARLLEEEQREIVANGNGEIKKAAKREREKRAGDAKRKRRTKEEIDRERAEKEEKKSEKEIRRAAFEAEFERSQRRDALGSLLEYYDQPTDKAREAAEWFDIDERGRCDNEFICVGGIRRAAEFLKALADSLEGRGLSQEPVYDDDDAADDDGNAIPDQSEPGQIGKTELQADRSRCA